MRALRWATIILLLATVVLPLPALADSGGTSASFGRDVVVAEGERLVGDLLAFGGNVHLMPGAVVDGNVMTIGSAVTVEGRVEGDVVAMGGRVTLQSSAAVIGDLIVFGDLTRERGALVRGSVIEGLEAAAHFPGITRATVVPPRQGPGPSTEPAPAAPTGPVPTAVRGSTGLGRSLGVLVVAVLMAALLATLLPGALHRTSDVMRTNWGLSLGIGALTVVLAVLLTVVFAVLVLVCVGLPLLVVLGVAFLGGTLLGWAAAGQIVGQFLAPRLRVHRPTPLVETVLGTTVITIATMVPCLGPALGLGLLCWGLGGAVLGNTETLRGLPAPLPARPPRTPTPPTAGPADQAASADAAQKGDTKPLDTTRWPFVPDDEDPGTHQ